MSDFELVQLHDARVEEVVVRSGGEALLRFAHVTVYEKRAHERYDVVSYSAELVGQGVVDVHCAGTVDSGSKVSGLWIDGFEMSSAEETALFQGAPRGVATAGLVFFNGARISLKCSQVSLRLQQRGRVLETWEGPL